MIYRANNDIHIPDHLKVKYTIAWIGNQPLDELSLGARIRGKEQARLREKKHRGRPQKKKWGRVPRSEDWRAESMAMRLHLTKDQERESKVDIVLRKEELLLFKSTMTGTISD